MWEGKSLQSESLRKPLTNHPDHLRVKSLERAGNNFLSEFSHPSSSDSATDERIPKSTRDTPTPQSRHYPPPPRRRSSSRRTCQHSIVGNSCWERSYPAAGFGKCIWVRLPGSQLDNTMKAAWGRPLCCSRSTISNPAGESRCAALSELSGVAAL